MPPSARTDEEASPAASSASAIPPASRPTVHLSSSSGVRMNPANSDKRFFGLRQPEDTYNAPPFRDDYAARLPEDAYGDETQPNARVWRAYEEEAAAFDSIMVGQARDGLDVMLVFAGLFSAVVTSFLVQVSQNLQADYSEMTALLLHDLVVIQLVSPGGAPSANITVPSADPTAKFAPDALDVWVNGLWAISLASSLIVALSAVPIKQWLHHYVSLPSGTPGLRSHVRHRRFMGFERWHVTVIIGLLPIVMHASLALFMVGLVLFYIPLRLSLTCAIAFISLLLLILYITSNILPIIRPDCPYHTPLTAFCFQFVQWFGVVYARGSEWGRKLLNRVPIPWAVTSKSPRLPLPAPSAKSLHDLEASQIARDYDQLSVVALDWLFGVSSNPSLHSVALEAISGLPFGMEDYAQRTWSNAESMISLRDTLMHDYTSTFRGRSGSVDWISGYQQATMVERLCRSVLFLPHPMNHNVPIPNPGVMFAPRLAAAIAASHLSPSYRCNSTPEGYLILSALTILGDTHDKELLHPSIWRNCLAATYSHDLVTLPGPLWSATLSRRTAVVLARLLNLSPISSQRRTGIMQQTMSLNAFLAEHPPWDAVQQMMVLRQFTVDPTISLAAHRVQIMAWKFALDNLENPDIPKSAVGSLLEGVLGQVCGSLTMGFKDGAWPATVSCLLARVLKESLAARLDFGFAATRDQAKWLRSLSRIYWEFSEEDADFAFPFLSHLLSIMAKNAGGVPCYHVAQIMWHALERGHDEALTSLREENWIDNDLRLTLHSPPAAGLHWDSNSVSLELINLLTDTSRSRLCSSGNSYVLSQLQQECLDHFHITQEPLSACHNHYAL